VASLTYDYRRGCTALLFALRTCAYVGFVGGSLVPDTASYAAGGSCWSSPVACGAGFAFGYRGVLAVGVVGALALGWVLGAVRLRRSAQVLAFPFGMHASPDAAGVAMASVAVGRNRWGLCAVACAVHLQAGMVAGCVLLARGRLGVFPAALLACVGSVMGQGLLNGFHGQQVRYLLPALVLLALYGARRGAAQPARACDEFCVYNGTNAACLSDCHSRGAKTVLVPPETLPRSA